MTLPQRILFFLLAVIGMAALTPMAATASKGDRDRDGLTNRQERKLKTNPRKADTDRDTLRDGREVKTLKTNPRKADTDGDGVKDGVEVRDGFDPRDRDSDDDGASDRFERKGVITSIEGDLVSIRTRIGTEIGFTVDSSTFLEGADRNGDGVLTLADFTVGDRVEVNLSTGGSTAQTLELKTDDDDLNEAEGRITAIEGDSVTIREKRGRTRTFIVDVDSFLRAPDRDGSGTVTVADLATGDDVEVHLSVDGIRALSLEVEYDDDEYGDDDGYGDDDAGEVEGRIEAIDYETGSVTVVRRGWTRTAFVDGTTFLRGPDTDLSGTVELVDFRVGDEVEGRLSTDGSTFLSLKYEGSDEDDDGGPGPGSGRSEVEGTIIGIDLDAGTVTISRFNGTELTLTAVAGTKFEIMDRDTSGTRDLADFEIGDRVEAKYDKATAELLKLEL